MALRATMTDLIAKVAAMVSDPDQTVFTPQYYQDTLDRYRTDYRMWPLVESVDVSTSAIYEWLTYYTGGTGGSVITDWEADARVQANIYTDITSLATIDFLSGRITFAATQYPPVWWTGKTYDVFAAAADLCDARSALTSDQYLMKDNNQFLNRQQVPENWQRMAGIYRRRARPRTALLARSDARYS